MKSFSLYYPFVDTHDIKKEKLMNLVDFLANVKIGNSVQIVWKGSTFDPDAVLKPSETPIGLSRVYTCGYIAHIGKDFITLAIDTTFEAGNTNPSFRSLINIPTGTIEDVEIYGKVSQ
jgi:hypothetical protein